ETVFRKLYRGDDLVPAQIGVSLRRVPGQSMEIGKCNGPCASGAHDMNLGLERGQRDTHVGRMRRDARLACAEDRIVTINPIDGRAAAAGLTFVAGRGGVIEIEAARAL